MNDYSIKEMRDLVKEMRDLVEKAEEDEEDEYKDAGADYQKVVRIKDVREIWNDIKNKKFWMKNIGKMNEFRVQDIWKRCDKNLLRKMLNLPVETEIKDFDVMLRSIGVFCYQKDWLNLLLCICHKEGYCTEVDEKKAYYFFSKAIEEWQNHPSNGISSFYDKEKRTIISYPLKHDSIVMFVL